MGRLPNALVLDDESPLPGGTVGPDDWCLQGDDLPVEPALRHSQPSFTLGLESQPVDILTCDFVFLSDPLACTEFIGHIPGEPRGRHGPGTVVHIGPKPDPTHGLDAAGDPDLDGPGSDEVGYEVVGLLGRTALTVDRGGSRPVRKAPT